MRAFSARAILLSIVGSFGVGLAVLIGATVLRVLFLLPHAEQQDLGPFIELIVPAVVFVVAFSAGIIASYVSPRGAAINAMIAASALLVLSIIVSVQSPPASTPGAATPQPGVQITPPADLVDLIAGVMLCGSPLIGLAGTLPRRFGLTPSPAAVPGRYRRVAGWTMSFVAATTTLIAGFVLDEPRDLALAFTAAAAVYAGTYLAPPERRARAVDIWVAWAIILDGFCMLLASSAHKHAFPLLSIGIVTVVAGLAGVGIRGRERRLIRSRL